MQKMKYQFQRHVCDVKQFVLEIIPIDEPYSITKFFDGILEIADFIFL